MVSRGVLIGAAVAVGGLMLVPGVAQAVGRAGRPLMRAAVRTGATAYDEFRKAGAEAYEHMEDIVAEMKAEAQAAREAAEEEVAAAAESAAQAAEGGGGR